MNNETNSRTKNRLTNIMKQIKPKQENKEIEQNKLNEIKFFPTKEEILRVSKEIEKESENSFKTLIPFKYLEEELKNEIIEMIKKQEGINLEEENLN
eukprot:gene1050-10569_t